MKTTQNAHSGPRWDPIRIFHGRETTFIVLLTENGYGRRVSTFNFMKSILFWTRLLPTDGPTNGWTHSHIELLLATKKSKRMLG